MFRKICSRTYVNGVHKLEHAFNQVAVCTFQDAATCSVLDHRVHTVYTRFSHFTPRLYLFLTPQAGTSDAYPLDSFRCQALSKPRGPSMKYGETGLAGWRRQGAVVWMGSRAGFLGMSLEPLLYETLSSTIHRAPLQRTAQRTNTKNIMLRLQLGQLI